jgi:predicted GIY-YIG superfamily endonuclease
MDGFDDLTGRLVVSFKRTGRQSYLKADKWTNEIKVSELMPKKMVVKKFYGYNNILISKKELELIIDQSIESWKGALSNVSGVYLITDKKTGKLYVGSATGENGIWSRWSEYSKNGHGGNKNLIKILKDEGDKYSDNFQYSVLEIADTHSSDEDVLKRESYWKNVLCSRDYGYNAN